MRPIPPLLLALTALAVLPHFQEVEAQERPLTLDTLPVLGSRVGADLPVNTREVRIWTRREIERVPARTVADVLAWTTGVELAARSPAQADLSIRGAGFEQVLVLVDGVRVSDPQTGHFDLNLAVPLERVERIEILRGPASAAYGSDAVGGVVNVVTRRDGHWSGRMEAGSFGTVSAALHGGFGLRGMGTLQFAVEEARSDGHREGTDWESRLATVTLRAPLAGGGLVGQLGSGHRQFGADGFYAPFPSFEDTRARTASLAWSPAPSASIRLEPRMTWRSHDDDFILVRTDPDIYRNRHTSSQLGGELVARAVIGPRAAASAGLEAGRDELESNALGARSEGRTAGFAEAAFFLRGGSEATVGVRYDDHARWGGFTSPSVALSVPLGPRTRIRTSAGRAFRGPTWTERHYEDPEHRAREDLRPERSASAEVGGEVEAGTGVRVGVTVFRRSSRDLIDWARPAGEEAVWETTNVNRATFRGIEAEAHWALDERTTLTAGSSHLSLRADAAPGLESKYALRPLGDQLHLAVGRGFGRDFHVALRGTRARRAGDPTHHLLDMRLEAPVLGGFLFLDGRNLTGSDHPDLTGHPVAGRAFYFGIRVGG
jgi:vitamin B12 transporter